MGAPMAARFVTLDGNGTTIDDAATITMTKPYEIVWLISRGGAWFVV
jgi:hypothetical protein